MNTGFFDGVFGTAIEFPHGIQQIRKLKMTKSAFVGFDICHFLQLFDIFPNF